MELMQASRQWSSRPDDERFTSLATMGEHFARIRAASREVVVPNRKIEAVATDNRALVIRGPNGHDYSPTHYAFGQLAQLAEAPGGYLRTLPAPMAADCINYGLQFRRSIEDVGVLLQRNLDGAIDGDDAPIIRCATGPRYGRIWNADVVGGLVRRIGDGVTGDWTVPGEFGRAVTVTKENTTLYASDRDMFVFLADERNRVEIPNRRDGKAGTLARGFFVWNSEVGDRTLGVATFLFDYACSNRIVWGATKYRQITVRHTPKAPVRWVDEIMPALRSYANEGTAGIVEGIAAAQKARVVDKLDDFLARRFTRTLAPKLKDLHMLEEGRPIESLWDVATAATAYARSIPHQDRRVDMEREAGKVLDLASV
jgi:hypothetical protein